MLRVLWFGSDLLLAEDVIERSHVAVFMSSKNLTEGAGGDTAGDAVDVYLLILVFLTHRLICLNFWNRFTDGHRGHEQIQWSGAFLMVQILTSKMRTP